MCGCGVGCVLEIYRVEEGLRCSDNIGAGGGWGKVSVFFKRIGNRIKCYILI